MRLRWVAGFVGVSVMLLSSLSTIRNEAGDVDPGYYSLSAEVARITDKPDSVTVMNNDNNIETLMLTGDSASGASR
ncbi:hypothetical protein L2750_06230 [Shewanella submarina]|uniref:Uncharacterized protein n=1 Tax=Shewanella submarina TaxID=2016376 RepID=A0ABV7GBJ5_9GAMM|nr:hypothetical protein [Shewanella submarina]MCL1036746.1 hypothetical protein [Shewanella submarina]